MRLTTPETYLNSMYYSYITKMMNFGWLPHSSCVDIKKIKKERMS
jgi:hypothetical protein